MYFIYYISNMYKFSLVYIERRICTNYIYTSLCITCSYYLHYIGIHKYIMLYSKYIININMRSFNNSF